MKSAWSLPARDAVLENQRVRLGPVDPDRDLDELFAAASVLTNGDDLFRYHVNVPAMTDRGTFERYLRAKQAHPAEVLYGVFSHRLGRLVFDHRC